VKVLSVERGREGGSEGAREGGTGGGRSWVFLYSFFPRTERKWWSKRGKRRRSRRRTGRRTRRFELLGGCRRTRRKQGRKKAVASFSYGKKKGKGKAKHLSLLLDEGRGKDGRKILGAKEKGNQVQGVKSLRKRRTKNETPALKAGRGIGKPPAV